MKKNAEVAPTKTSVLQLDKAVLDTGFFVFRRSFDTRYGGFGQAPKFLHTMDLRLLLRCWKRFGDDHALHIVDEEIWQVEYVLAVPPAIYFAFASPDVPATMDFHRRIFGPQPWWKRRCNSPLRAVPGKTTKGREGSNQTGRCRRGGRNYAVVIEGIK